MASGEYGIRESLPRAAPVVRQPAGARWHVRLSDPVRLSILYPFWVTLITSFSTVDEVTTLGFKLWISEWSTGAYRFAFSTYGNAGVAYYNSIYRVVLGTSVAIVLTLLAAYPLAKRNLPGRNVLTIVLLITLFFAGGLVPNYLLIRRLGLIDTRWALILPLAVNGFYIIIARNFLMTIDPAYEDAALVDGAGYPQILARIMVPLSKPIIATLALWTAVAHWNAWFDALIYIRSERKIVLQTLLRRMIQQIQEALLEWTASGRSRTCRPCRPRRFRPP